MKTSLDFQTLRRAYAEDGLTPSALAEQVLSRLASPGADAVWISRVAPKQLRAAARALEERAAAAGIAALPLYGLPFAVKDNIDVAGMATTAACAEFAYTAARSAPVVELLARAGALLVGKTNLDQFATGLVGVRSPYGVPPNPFDDGYIPGGSSSGSAVAVAAGQVAFALGTDTAGSGRVPAAFNNVVGLKPTRGLISTGGVVPACRSLDCVSIFALTVPDAVAVLAVATGFDPEDPYSRSAPPGFVPMAAVPAGFAFGVPRPDQRVFFGNDDAAAWFEAAIARLEALGGRAVVIDLAPFLEAGSLLYRGPWLAERSAAFDSAIGGNFAALHPVTRRIVDGGGAITGVEAFRGHHRLAALRQATERAWREIDVLVVPTAGTIYRIAEIEADPLGLNENLGRYTSFANLLDLSALAVPNGFQRNGLPTGVTLLAPAFHDGLLAALGAAFHASAGLPLGATGAALPRFVAPARLGSYPGMPIAVVGAHLSGQPLNGELLALGARFHRATRTAADYRLYALPDDRRPGLVCRPGDGVAIEIEIWDMPVAAVGAFLAGIAPPLGLGTVVLADGGAVTGFLCEAHAVDGARDISEFGGWRAWREARGRHGEG